MDEGIGYVLQLFRYLTKSYFFNDYFSEGEILQFLLFASTLKQASNLNYFELYGGNLLNQLNIYSYLTDQFDLSRLKKMQRYPFIRLLSVLFSQASNSNVLLFVISCLRVYQVPSRLNRHAIIFCSQICDYFNIEVTNLDINYEQLCEIGRFRGTNGSEVRKAARFLISNSGKEEDEIDVMLNYIKGL